MPFSIIEKYDRQFEQAGVLMNVFIAFQFLQLWIFPQPEQAEKIYSIIALLNFEIFAILLSFATSFLPKKMLLFFIFPLFGLFAYALNQGVPNNTILITYLLTIFNRTRYMFYNDNAKGKIMLFSLIAMMVYMFLLMVVAIFSNMIPPLGLTNNFLVAAGYNFKGEGLFIDSPHHGMCMGVLYFCTIATLEIFIRWIKKDLIKFEKEQRNEK